MSASLSPEMWNLSCILIIGILGLSSYAVGTLPDYVSEDGNPLVLINTRLCGNGKLDPGEACDCGPGVQKCMEDSCCQTNCQLKLHSQCSDSDPCCERCKYKPRGTICNKPINECSIPEYCTGYNGECSANILKRNGANCTGEFGKGICIHGSCKSFNQPCQEAWRSSEAEPVRDQTKCSSGSICVNQSCIPVRDVVNGHTCPRGVHKQECSGRGECTTSYTCHCSIGWKGDDCSVKDTEDLNTKINNEKPGKVTKVGPEQRDSKSNTTALVGGLVGFVILVSVIFVVMAFRYLPSRPAKDDSIVYPPVQADSAEPETPAAERPTQQSNVVVP